MRIAVCVKWVPDPDYPALLGADGATLASDGLVFMADPIDMVAAEAAVRVKEAAGGTVAVYSAGPADAEKGLRAALALGGDEGARITLDGSGFSGGVRAARLLGAAIAKTSPDLVLCGVQSSDSGSGIVPAALAGMLRLPLVSGVVRMEVRGGELELERRMEGGRHEVLRARPPLVISVQPSLCQPRYPALLARRKADRVAIQTLSAGDLGLPEVSSGLQTLGLRPPRPRTARLVAPAPEMDARERYRFILAGGPAQNRTPSRLSGPVPAMVDELLRFLQTQGVATVNGAAV